MIILSYASGPEPVMINLSTSAHLMHNVQSLLPRLLTTKRSSCPVLPLQSSHLETASGPGGYFGGSFVLSINQPCGGGGDLVQSIRGDRQ